LNTNISHAYRISIGYKAITLRYFTSLHFTASSEEEMEITSQKVRFVGELLSPPAPGIARADQAHQKDTLFRVNPGTFQAPISGFRRGFPNPQETMPTPTENIVLNAYFWKISDLNGF